MNNIEIYLGNISFGNGKKEFIRITPYVENTELTLEDSSNNILPQINEIVCGFFDNKNLMSEVDGLYEFIKNNREFDLFPLVIFYKEKIIFNGIIQLYDLNIPNGYRFINSKPLEYTFSNITHKSAELKCKYINKLISYKNINILNYLNYLFENNPRITKYINYNNFEEELELLTWGNNFDTHWGQDTASIIWGESEGVTILDGINLTKSLCYNYETIGVGDSVHIFGLVDNENVRDNYVIKSVKNFTENTKFGIIDYISILNMDYILDDILININKNGSIKLYLNNSEIASGTYNKNTNSVTVSGEYNGIIYFKSSFSIDNISNISSIWGEDSLSVTWGVDSDYLIWGFDDDTINVSINTSKLHIECFEKILVRSGTTNIRFKVGYHVIGLDDVSDLEIQNPIVNFKNPLELIDTLSTDYLFNYSVSNDGLINLYTNTSDMLENENYILQIGNNEEELIYDSTIINTNCTLSDQYGDSIDVLSDYVTEINIIPTSVVDYQSKITINNLISNKRYILSIISDANEILIQNSGINLSLDILDYYNDPKFAFIVPNGQTSIDDKQIYLTVKIFEYNEELENEKVDLERFIDNKRR